MATDVMQQLLDHEQACSTPPFTLKKAQDFMAFAKNADGNDIRHCNLILQAFADAALESKEAARAMCREFVDLHRVSAEYPTPLIFTENMRNAISDARNGADESDLAAVDWVLGCAEAG